MKNVLHVQTPNWECCIRTRQQGPAADLTGLMKVIGATKKVEAEYRCSNVCAQWIIDDVGCPLLGNPQGIVLAKPSLFENRTYSLKISSRGKGVKLLSVQHPSSQEFNDSIDDDGDAFRCTWKTGNDVGWFSLVISYVIDGVTKEDRVAWQVWPTKLDYGADFQALVNCVSKAYPLWLFRFAAPTEHDAGRSQVAHDRFLLLWLKQFEGLYQQLYNGVRTILRSPHQRLATEVQVLRADSLRGPIPARLEEDVAEGTFKPNRRYRLERMRSSLDTPENRFIKYALVQCLKGLDSLQRKIDEPSVSKYFQDKFQGWKRFLQYSLAQPLFKTIGSFDGISQESLVLHHRVGYRQVYSAWIELRHYMEFFAEQPKIKIGMRQISELYEIWCFLEIRRILTSDLNFEEVPESYRMPQIDHTAVSAKLKDGMGAAFRFRHKEDSTFTLRLAHEPIYSKLPKQENAGIRVYSVTQKPDIVLEAEFPESFGKQRKGFWVFDAKYRLNTSFDEDRYEVSDPIAKAQYLAPADAIDQMHRYRDSLILKASEGVGKSRPTIGAFALYPGSYEQNESNWSNNPYHNSMQEIGIGAFPLLPREDSSGNAWLKRYLQNILGNSWAANISQKSVVIPPSGLNLYLPGMTLLIPVPGDPSKPRIPEYMERMSNGTQRWYHTYADEKFSVDIETVATVRYIAPVLPSQNGAVPSMGIVGIYECKNPCIYKRGTLSAEQTGAASPSRNREKDCWLFELGAFHKLEQPIELHAPWNYVGQWFQYADFSDVINATNWGEIHAVVENPWKL